MAPTADTRDTLQAALDIFKGPHSTAIPSGGRQFLKELAEKHKQSAAKAALLASSSSGSGNPPPDVKRVGVTSSLEQSAIGLISCAHGFTADAGPSLATALKQLCTAVVQPTQELVDQLARGDAAGCRRAVGLVWGACDELCRAPLDNKGCLFRQLADVMQGVKAAAKELEELIEASERELAEAGAGTNGDLESPANGDSAEGEASAIGNEDEEEPAVEDDEDEDEDDDFRDMGTLSAGELRTAKAAAALLEAAQTVLRFTSRPLLEGPAVDSSHCLDEWESLAWHGGKLRSSCEALVACLYPPHDEDAEDLAGEAEAVATCLELMMGEMPEAYLAGTAGQELQTALRGVEQQVECALGQLRDALGRAAPEVEGS